MRPSTAALLLLTLVLGFTVALPAVEAAATTEERCIVCESCGPITFVWRTLGQCDDNSRASA